MEQTIAIVGLGLIGGSLAKGLKNLGGYKIIGFDREEQAVLEARRLGAIDKPGNGGDLADADLVLVALHPKATLEYARAQAKTIKKGALLLDMCGVKEEIFRVIDPLAAENGFVYIGGHPMAGKEFSGFAHADPAIFRDASMLLVPGSQARECHIHAMERLFAALGFGQVVTTAAGLHDQIIAYTSQLAHVVSSAYIKSPTAARRAGYSAGSYKDLTRVARLNEGMWTELFLMNQRALVQEIDGMLNRLTDYRDAIANGEEEKLRELLKEGRRRKETLG